MGEGLQHIRSLVYGGEKRGPHACAIYAHVIKHIVPDPRGCSQLDVGEHRKIFIVPSAGNASGHGQLKELIDIAQPVGVLVFRCSLPELHLLENVFL